MATSLHIKTGIKTEQFDQFVPLCHHHIKERIKLEIKSIHFVSVCLASKNFDQIKLYPNFTFDFIANYSAET